MSFRSVFSDISHRESSAAPAPPLNLDPSVPVFHGTFTPPSKPDATPVSQIVSYPLQDGTCQVFAHLDRIKSVESVISNGHWIDIGRFPLAMHEALTAQNFGGFVTDRIDIYTELGVPAAYGVREKGKQILTTLMEKTGINPLPYEAQPDVDSVVVSSGLGRNPLIGATMRSAAAEKVLRNNTPEISEETVKALVRDNGAVLDPNTDVGDRYAQYVQGRVVRWDAEPRHFGDRLVQKGSHVLLESPQDWEWENDGAFVNGEHVLKKMDPADWNGEGELNVHVPGNFSLSKAEGVGYKIIGSDSVPVITNETLARYESLTRPGVKASGAAVTLEH